MVPEDWKVLSLGELCSGNLQTGPFGSQLHASEYTEKGVAVLMPKDLQNCRANTKSAAKISPKRAEELEKHRLKDGDLIFSRRGDVARFALIDTDSEGSICGTGCLKAIPNKQHSPTFIAYFLQKNAVKKWLEQNAVGQTMPNMNTAILFELPLLSASSKAEENKIAKILQTWDRAITITEKLIDASKQQKKALMQQLLTGKKRFAGFDGEWETIELKECATFLDGKRKPIKQEERAHIQGHFPYYGATGIIDYVNDYIFDDELILLGEDGENILSRSLPHVFVIKGKSWVNNHAHVLKASPGMDTNYLCMYLENLDYKKYNSGSAQPKLNKAVCERIPVKVPCLLEQQKIANTISCAENLIAIRKLKLSHLKQEKKALMQQLLTGKQRVKVDE